MPPIPTRCKFLLGFIIACPLAFVFTWFGLLTNICSNPQHVNTATQNTVAYNCHGATVFITPLEQDLLHWLIPVGFVVVVLTNVIIVAGVIRIRVDSSSVKIITTPPGEAPQWVREKWVGLELPLQQWSASPTTSRTGGVLSGPRGVSGILVHLVTGNFQRQNGYKVNVLKAVAILERASPEAAHWWRTSAPHLMTPSRCFLFPEHVCKVIR